MEIAVTGTKYKVFIRWSKPNGETFDGDPNITHDRAAIPVMMKLAQAEADARFATNQVFGAVTCAIMMEVCVEVVLQEKYDNSRQN